MISPRHLARRLTIAILTISAAGAFLVAAPAAQADPALGISISHKNVFGAAGLVDPDTGSGETVVRSSQRNAFTIVVTNSGSTETVGPVTVAAKLPEGLFASVGDPQRFSGTGWQCQVSNGGTAYSCTKNEALAAGASWSGAAALTLILRAGEGAPDAVTFSATVAGGGAAASATAGDPASVVTVPFGIREFTTSVKDAANNPYGQAGGHPFSASTSVVFHQIDEGSTAQYLRNAGNIKSLFADLPPGFLGNPQNAPKCPQASYESIAINCPANTAVGFVKFAPGGNVTGPFYSALQYDPVFNLQPAAGHPAAFGFVFAGVPVALEVEVRSDGDYGVTVGDSGVGSNITPIALELTLCENGIAGILTLLKCSPTPVAGHTSPFLTNPSKCGGAPPVTTMRTSTFEEPNNYRSAQAYTNVPSGSGPAPASEVTGCNQLDFSPTIAARPTTNVADAPSGLNFGLHLPQSNSAETLAEADLKDTKVVLPAGMAVNPAAAGGLEACSTAQIGLTSAVGQIPIHFNMAAPACPSASKIGTVEITTPLLAKPLGGSLYLAKQTDNPFGSLLALYIAIDDPETGLVIKLAGDVSLDQVNGQLTATFAENPQLPFEDLKLNVFSGARAPLRTPATCGTKATVSELTPWSAPESGPPATPGGSFDISQSAGAGTCPTTTAGEPNAPKFSAGTESAKAGAYSPFVLKLTREDGSQELKGINATLPLGLTGRLAGIPYCPDAAIAAAEGKTGAEEQGDPSCSKASEVGSVDVSVGSGSAPYAVKGKAYLAGPYKGAPVSLAIITPAVAGPFDVGTVVVRSALYVNPETAQITVKSDPIPTILQGIPLDVRSIAVHINRPEFTLNPTSCNPTTLTGTAVGVASETAVSNRFQVGDCDKLAFGPQLKLQLKGATGRIGHPALTAVVTAAQGEANIARAQVNLPHGEFLDQGNLNKTCTKPVLLAGQCPESSIYGYAKAWTPLLDKPLEGAVYLVGGYGFKLPALVAELNGQIKVLLVGKVDSGKNKGIRNTFEVVPDAPVEKFELRMKGGKKYGLLENSENLCTAPKARRRANVFFTGQNGKVEQSKPLVANQCGRGKKAKKKAHK